jgi:hypothetical protein
MRRFILQLILFVRSRANADLAREIGSHVQLLEDADMANGMSRDEPRCAGAAGLWRALVMLAASFGPARRGLGIDATPALRED